MRNRMLLVCLIMGLSFMPVISWAALTGNIAGTIVDDTGQPLPGTLITVTGSNLQGARTAYTSEDGSFRVPLIPPGLYKIQASMAGMKTIERNDIEVNINKTTRIDLTMELSTLEEVVVVTAEAPVLDSTSATVGVNINRSFTERLPRNDSFQSAFTMGAGTVGGGNPNIHGGTNIDNVILFDGIDVTDPVTHTFAQNLNADAIEQVEVQTGGFEAEYGRSMGGIVNVVTKTGGNNYEGIFRIKYMNDAWNAEPDSEEKPENVIKDNYEPTLSIGGPIMKDKLWFFASYRYRVDDAKNEVRDSRNEDGSYNFASVDNDEVWQWGHANLTYNITEAHNLQFSFSWVPAVLNNRGSVSYSPDAQYKWEQGGDRYGLIYNYIVSSNFYVNAKVGFFNSYIYVKPQNDSGVPCVYDSTDKIYFNNYNQIDENDRSRTQASVMGTYYADNLFMGSHEFKAGLEYQRLNEKRFLDYTTGGYYEEKAGEPYAYYEYTGEFKTEKNKANYFGFFIQDSWEIMSGLTIKPGVRVERTTYFNKRDDEVHTFEAIVSPRLGAAYDLSKDGRSKIHMSYGRYYKMDDLNIIFGDPGPTATRNTWIYDPTNAEANAEGYYLDSWTGGEESNNMLDEDIKPEHTDEFIAGYEREITQNFSVGIKYVYRYTTDVWEDIGYYVDDQGNLHRVDEIDWNSPDTNGDGVPDDARDFWDNSKTMGGWLITNPHGGFRQYNGISISATAKKDNFLVEASYTYSEARGTSDAVSSLGEDYNTPFTGAYDSPYDAINLNGPLSYDSPHYFKINGSYRLPFGITIGTSSFYRAGYPYQRLVEKPAGMGVGNYINEEGRGAYRMDDVIQVSLSLQKDFDFGKFGMLTAIIDCMNVLDNQVETYVNYNDGEDFGLAEEWAYGRQFEFQLKYSF